MTHNFSPTIKKQKLTKKRNQKVISHIHISNKLYISEYNKSSIDAVIFAANSIRVSQRNERK